MISEQTTFTSRLAKEDLLGSEFAQEMQKHFTRTKQYMVQQYMSAICYRLISYNLSTIS